MFRKAVLGAVCAGLIGLTASRAAEPENPAPTPEQVSAARAVADTIIAASGAPGLFENVTEGVEAAVRHRASKLVCTFPIDASEKVMRVGNGAVDIDIQCVAWKGVSMEQVHLVRGGKGAAADARARGTITDLGAAIHRTPTVERIADPVATIPASATYRFQDRSNPAAPAYAWVGAVDFDGWRLTTLVMSRGDANPTPEAQSAQMKVVQTRGELRLLLAIHQIRGDASQP